MKMKRLCVLIILFLMAGAVLVSPVGNLRLVGAANHKEQEILRGRIIAVGIPGASAISPVGTFLPGGPVHDKPAFQAYTQPGRILDPARILVGSTSNFGEPLARADQLPGSFLSIDPRGGQVLMPRADFAATGGQASTLNGMVQLYSANSPDFLNSIHNAGAATANYTSVTNPLGLSINNAFGRLWPANAPYGLYGQGTSTIADPTGEPLAGPPNANIGGVYAGQLTNRQPQLVSGALSTGAVGTALLGRSPDGSSKAVFVVVCADGSIVQEHTLKGLDGLAPANTVASLLGRSWSDDEEKNDNNGDKDGNKQPVTPRLGVLVNYSPARILYVSEPFENSIAAITLSDDGVIFHVAGIHRLNSPMLDHPVDLAPAEMETSDPDWSSNTTLDVGSDFYVANRGNNTIVRMRQDGTVVAVRSIRLADGRPLGDARLNGIAASPDGSKLWVSVTGHLPGYGKATGAVLELPAFGE